MNENIENEENVFEIEDYTTQEMHHYYTTQMFQTQTLFFGCDYR